MLKGLLKNYLYPIATLSGSIIGVGFLSLPYIAVKVGIWPMLFYFVVLTIFIVSLHLMFAAVSLKTPDFKRFPGFVGYYFGKPAEIFNLVMMIFGLLGTLLVYLLVGSEFLMAIFSPVLGGSIFVYVVAYFLAGSIIIYFGIKVISRIEFWMLCLLLISLGLVFIKGFSEITLSNIFISNLKFDLPAGRLGISNLFLPYGAIMFSLWGAGLIPEVEEMVRGRKKSLKKIIIIGTLIPAVIYLLFIFLVAGITGADTTPSALVGLKNFFGGQPIALLVLSIGVLTTFTAFLAQGILLKKMFMYDMGFKHHLAWALTCLVPLGLFILGFNSFILLISFIGGVFLGVNGIFILFMYGKIGGSKKVIYPLVIFFILGIIYEIVYFVK